MGKMLIVGNLCPSLESDDLRELFALHGKVLSAQVATDRDTGDSLGFGFVEMESAAEARLALEALNGVEINGHRLSVNEDGFKGFTVRGRGGILPGDASDGNAGGATDDRPSACEHVRFRIRVGATEYPLKVRLHSVFTPPEPDRVGEIQLKELGPRLLGTGPTHEAAWRDWCHKFHKTFQTLLAKRPFEMGADEKSLWELLGHYVDISRYRAATPLVLRQVGEVLASNPLSSVVRWGDDTEEQIPIEKMPAEYVTFKLGQRFEAVVQRDPTTYTIRVVEHVRALPPLWIPTPAEAEEFWNQSATSKSLPETTWD